MNPWTGGTWWVVRDSWMIMTCKGLWPYDRGRLWS